MNILVVDDEPVVREYVSAVLRSMGHEVVQARDGEHALTVAKQIGPSLDAVVTDIDMPRVNGIRMWQVMRYIVPRSCRVLFMSGAAAKYEGHGWEGEFLQKPFSSTLLKQKVAALSARP